MSRTPPLPPPGFEELSAEEQVEYVQALWDRIVASEEKVPVPKWHEQEINRRLKDFERNPADGISWDELKAYLRSRSR